MVSWNTETHFAARLYNNFNLLLELHKLPRTFIDNCSKPEREKLNADPVECRPECKLIYLPGRHWADMLQSHQLHQLLPALTADAAVCPRWQFLKGTMSSHSSRRFFSILCMESVHVFPKSALCPRSFNLRPLLRPWAVIIFLPAVSCVPCLFSLNDWFLYSHSTNPLNGDWLMPGQSAYADAASLGVGWTSSGLLHSCS